MAAMQQPLQASLAAEAPFGRAIERLRMQVNAASSSSSSSNLRTELRSTIEELLGVLSGYNRDAYAQQRLVRYVSSAKHGHKDTLLTLPPTVSRFDDNMPAQMGRMGLPELIVRMTCDDRIAELLNDDSALHSSLCFLVAKLNTGSENKAKFLIRNFSRYLEVLIKQTHFEDVKAAAGAALDSITKKTKVVETIAPEAITSTPLYRMIDGGFTTDINLSLERYQQARDDLLRPTQPDPPAGSPLMSTASRDTVSPAAAAAAASLSNPPSRGAPVYTRKQEALQRMNESIQRMWAGKTDDDDGTKNIPTFDHLESISAIIDSFDVIESRRPPGNALIAVNVLSKIARFSKMCTVDMLRSLREAGICEKVVDIVNRFSTTSDVVLSGVESVANLASDQEMGRIFGKLGMCEVIALTLSRFCRSSKQISIFCCAAISNLSLNNDDNKKRFRRGGVNEAVVNVLLCHSRFYNVEQWACRALANLAHGSDENRFELGSKMACECLTRLLERCLNKFRDGGAFERQFRPLSFYSDRKEREEAEQAENRRRSEDITHLIRVFPEDPLSLTQHIALSMAALKCLCHGSIGNAIRMTRAGSVEVIQQILSSHLQYRQTQNLRGVPLVMLEDIILSCVCCLRYILCRDSSELRNAALQMEAVGLVESLVAVVSDECALSNPFIAKYSLWAIARFATPIRKRKQYRVKDVLTKVELEDLRAMGVVFDDPPVDGNTDSRYRGLRQTGSSYGGDDISFCSDSDDDGGVSVGGSNSVGEMSGLSAAGGDIRSELRAAGACEAVCRCLMVYAAKIEGLYGDILRCRQQTGGAVGSPSKLLSKFDSIKALPTEKKVKVLRNYNDVISVGLKTIQALCAKSSMGKKRLSEIRVDSVFECIQTLLDRQMAPPGIQKLLNSTRQRVL